MTETLVAALEVESVSKSFGGRRVLSDFSMDIQPGEVHALVGHNGSGKSTFVKVMAGFHETGPEAKAAVSGQTLALGDPLEAQRLGLRFVFQDLGLFHGMSVVDNVALGSDYPRDVTGRIDWRKARSETKKLLQSLGYNIDVNSRVEKLSMVGRTGVALARALGTSTDETRVLVLDEPTAALPSRSVEDLFAMIRRLTSRGIGILYISHRLDEVLSISDRVTVLRDGKKIVTRNAADLTESSLIEHMIGSTLDESARASSERDQSVEPILIADDLHTKELRGVSFEVRAGEVLGFAGIEGSGRGEIAGALFGGIERTGTVTVDGQVVPPRRTDRSITAGMGLVPADRSRLGLVRGWSVQENLTLPLLRSSFRGWFLNKRSEKKECEIWIEQLDIKTNGAGDPIGSLSGGNQQKVMLARWLRAEPHVMILDEPTQGVDVGSIARIYSVVRDAAAAGTAFIVCSSDEDELVAVCDRVIILNRGRISQIVSGDDINVETIERASLQSLAMEGTS